jgi:hypothetical protein
MRSLFTAVFVAAAASNTTGGVGIDASRSYEVGRTIAALAAGQAILII